MYRRNDVKLISTWNIQGTGTKDVTTPVKPISTFVTRFEQLLNRVKEVGQNVSLIELINGFVCLHGPRWNVCDTQWLQISSASLSGVIENRFGLMKA